jgi:hypothetical protein
VLSALSITLVIGFKADTHMLVPLYAVGVFTAFTLSQGGMVVRWAKMDKLWTLPAMLNLLGAICTGVVTLVIAITKFKDGAWVTIFAIAFVVSIFAIINRHYQYLAKELNVRPNMSVPEYRNIVLLLVPRMHKGILKAIGYAQSLSKDVRAMHVTLDPKGVKTVKDDWIRFGADIPLVILESPFRSLVDPILEYVDEAVSEADNLIVTVIVPQAVPKYPWQALLHNNAAINIKRALGVRRNVVVTNVRYFMG